MAKAAAQLSERAIVVFDPLLKTELAEAQAESAEIDAALARPDDGLAQSAQTGQRWYDAEVHRIRGEILLTKSPADPAVAEEAFLAAVAIAQAQKTRSFELRAALSLAKLYRATGRDADAHAALRPSLEGFSPTPEFPEIGEAFGFTAAIGGGAGG